jgi:hypothetical protein
MGQLLEHAALKDALLALGMTEGTGDDYSFYFGEVIATIQGRVAVFEYSYEELYASLDWENFEPRDLMEKYYRQKGVKSPEVVFKLICSNATKRKCFQMEYADKVAKHFNACGVPVQYYEIDGYSRFRVEPEFVRGPEPIDLFRMQVRHDFGMEFFFGDSSIVVDGEDVDRNIKEVFCVESLGDISPENPVDRVDYSSTYHYRHIVNALPDMLRVGIKKVRKETVEIVTALRKPITNCKKHFRPDVIGTITDYCVDFKASIHPPKNWNE